MVVHVIAATVTVKSAPLPALLKELYLIELDEFLRDIGAPAEARANALKRAEAEYGKPSEGRTK